MQLGFEDEREVPAKSDKGQYWTAYYTCIANGKRVFCWKYDRGSRCLLLVSNRPMPGADNETLTNEFQHTWRGSLKAVPSLNDPLLLQAVIHEITSGGNSP